MVEIQSTTIPDFERVKSTLTNLYFIAGGIMSDYYMRPSDSLREQKAREALINLALPLRTKMYVLNDTQAMDHMAQFYSNPLLFQLMDLTSVWLILQKVISKLGIDKIEQPVIPKHLAFMEDES